MKKTIGVASNKVQQRRSLGANSEIGSGVRADDTTAAEKRGPCFATSADRHILDKQPGFGEVRPTIEDHTSDRGTKTLSSDSRKAPMPSAKGDKIEIHRGYNYENVINEGDAYVT